jgi:predicted nucleotidyltransferase
MVTSEQVNINQIVSRLVSGLGDSLIAIILFGSKARGDDRAHSDWDLLIIANDLPARPMTRLRYLKDLLPESTRSTGSIIAKTPNEFEGSLTSLYLDIAIDGIILFDAKGYAEEKLSQLRKLILEKGLKRQQIDGGFIWRWKKFPGFGWSLDWKDSNR